MVNTVDDELAATLGSKLSPAQARSSCLLDSFSFSFFLGGGCWGKGKTQSEDEMLEQMR